MPLKPPAQKLTKPARKAGAVKPSPKAVTAARAARGKPKPVASTVIHAIFARLHAANPEPRGELEYVNPFTLLVAVVLSAQATDTGVKAAT